MKGSLLCIILLFLFCTVILSSCTFGKLYTYDIRLERPVSSQKLLFENDTLLVVFAFNEDNIQFDLYNKLDDALKINWKEISVSIDGQTKRVIPSYAYTVGFQGREPSITVAPKSKINDIIRTTDKLDYSDTSTGLSQLNIYPRHDQNWPAYREYIMGMKGRKIVLYLPFYLRNIYCSKTFEFVIADVQPQN